MELACGKTSSPCRRNLLAAGQIEDRNSQNAVKIAIDIVDAGFEFLPQDFLLRSS